MEIIPNSFPRIAIRIMPKDQSKEFIKDWAPGQNVTDYVVSATIEAMKPGRCADGSACG